MLATTYYIIARYMDGVRVVGYEVESVEGHRDRMTKRQVEELALNKQIINCTAQKYTNPKKNKETVVLKGVGCKLSDLPTIRLNKKSGEIDKRGVIVARIVDGKNTVSYAIRKYNGEITSVSRDNTMLLARKGALKNARAQRSKGELLMRGVKCDLAKLPIVKESSLVKH